MSRLDIVYFGDDWMLFYVDGELKFSDHRLEGADVLSVLKLEYEVHSFDSASQFDYVPPDKLEGLGIV